MKKLLRVLYPFFIYMTVTILTTSASFCLITIFYMLTRPGISLMAAVYDGEVWSIEQVLYITALAALITSLILSWFCKMDCVMRGKDLKKTFNIPKGFIYSVFAGIALCFFGNNLIDVFRLNQLFPGYDEVAETIYVGGFFRQLVCVGVLIPIAEEMVFRILGFRRLRDYWSFWPSALLSGFLFGLYHGNVVQFLYAFLLGFFIALAYELMDSPVVPILIHGTANMVSVIWTTWFGYMRGNKVVSVLVIAVAAAAIYFCLKKIREYGRLDTSVQLMEVNL